MQLAKPNVTNVFKFCVENPSSHIIQHRLSAPCNSFIYIFAFSQEGGRMVGRWRQIWKQWELPQVTQNAYPDPTVSKKFQTGQQLTRKDKIFTKGLHFRKSLSCMHNRVISSEQVLIAFHTKLLYINHTQQMPRKDSLAVCSKVQSQH